VKEKEGGPAKKIWGGKGKIERVGQKNKYFERGEERWKERQKDEGGKGKRGFLGAHWWESQRERRSSVKRAQKL